MQIMFYKKFNSIGFFLFINSFYIITIAQSIAFPGAEGFGKYTTGGRGGKVYEVTNLNNKGKGSLRAAINAKGPRTIVFRISGTIFLEKDLIIENGDLTITGQTAPGDGICIANYPLRIDADNVIIRYIRCRMGDLTKQGNADALSCIGQNNIIIDHCSFSWGIDEVATIRDNKYTTVQWCIIAEGLNYSFHTEEKDENGEPVYQKHGFGGIWGGSRATFHHNLLCNNNNRNPRFHGARYKKYPWEEIVDFRNNVIYNWGDGSSYGGEPSRHDGVKAKINMVNNYYKAGPATEKNRDRIVKIWRNDFGYSYWHITGNVAETNPKVFINNWKYGVEGISDEVKDTIRSDTAFEYSPISQQSAIEAYAYVLKEAGAIFPKRDSVDLRLITEVATGISTHGTLYRGGGNGIIDSQNDVGGWPELKTFPPPIDTDHDGMPDEWEIENKLDVNNPDDGNGDLDNDGFTNLEEYLNSLVFMIY